MWLLSFISAFTCLAAVQATIGLKITANPSSFKVELKREIRLHCSVDKSILGSSHAMWSRQVGDTPAQAMTSGASMDRLFHGNNRFTVDRKASPTNSNLIIYTLVIKDARYEDAATMICSTGNGRNVKQNIAICGDVVGKTCDCMLKEGLASPVCFREPTTCLEMESYKRAAVGLGICLAIVIAIGVVMAALLGKDCWSSLRQRHKHNVQRQEHEKRVRLSGAPPDIYKDSERLTLDPNDPDNTSVSESGVWSNSGGSQGDGNGHGNHSGRPGLKDSAPPPTEPLAHSTPPRERTTTQTHVNKAYEAEAEEPPTYANALIHKQPKEGKPKNKKSKKQAPTPLSQAVQNAGSRERLDVPSGGGRLERAPSSELLYNQPSTPNFSLTGYSGQQHPSTPTSPSTQYGDPHQPSPGQGYNPYPPQEHQSPYPPQHMPSVSAGVAPQGYSPQGVPASRGPQAPPRGTYSSPRQLEVLQSGTHQQPSGPYVDSHDTII